MCLKFPRKIEVKLRFCMLYCRSGGQVRSVGVEVGQCNVQQKCWYSWENSRVSLRRGILGVLGRPEGVIIPGRANGCNTYDQPVVGTSRPARTSLRNILRRHVTKIRSLNIFMAKMLHILLRNIPNALSVSFAMCNLRNY